MTDTPPATPDSTANREGKAFLAESWWWCQVGGTVYGPWRNSGEATAGRDTERRRLATRIADDDLPFPAYSREEAARVAGAQLAQAVKGIDDIVQSILGPPLPQPTILSLLVAIRRDVTKSRATFLTFLQFGEPT